ncbi:MAG: cytochrome D1 domain-containing protein [Gammaproteobacteria bacterium]|nr:cytochrome D1 domain-containing protein [Gammaproteobacteria bacterium]
MIRTALFSLLLVSLTPAHAADLRGTGDLALVIERASGSIQIIETTGNSSLGRIEGLGDLSHASAVYSRDERYAYIFGRDGGLTKVDMLTRKIVKRIMQAGNSIGGAISQDGTLVAVSNYEPGGVKIFDAATLALVADIPASYGEAKQTSKVIGLVDAPGQKFVFSLWDADEIWVADMSRPDKPAIQKFKGIGRNPYDALISPDGRYYIAGLFGEDGMALLDLWNLDAGVKRILDHYGKGEQKLPVYKMPHLEGWAMAGQYAFVPAVGHHEVLVIDTRNWSEAGRIKVHGQPIFVMARPDGRHVWVNFAIPNNDTLQVIDTQSLKIIKKLQPGKGVLHMEFEPRGEELWASVRDDDQLVVYDTESFEERVRLPANKPSGIFATVRAHKTGL